MTKIYTMDVEKDIDSAVRFADRLNKNWEVGEFYICGYIVEKFPRKVKKIAENHIIGGHGYYHEDFAKLSHNQAKLIIKRTVNIFKENNLNIQGWRFPGLSYTNRQIGLLAKEGLYDSSIQDSAIRRWGSFIFIRNWLGNLSRGIFTLPSPYPIRLKELPWSYADLNEKDISKKKGRLILHCYNLNIIGGKF